MESRTPSSSFIPGLFLALLPFSFLLGGASTQNVSSGGSPTGISSPRIYTGITQSQMLLDQKEIFETLFPGAPFDASYTLEYELTSLPVLPGIVAGWHAKGGTFQLTASTVFDLGDLQNEPPALVPPSVKAQLVGYRFSEVIGDLGNANGSQSVFGIAMQSTSGSPQTRLLVFGKSTMILPTSMFNATSGSCSESASNNAASHPPVPADLCQPDCGTKGGFFKDQDCINAAADLYGAQAASACSDFNDAMDDAQYEWQSEMKVAAKINIVCLVGAGVLGFFSGGTAGMVAVVACASALANAQIKAYEHRDVAEHKAEKQHTKDLQGAVDKFYDNIKDCCKACPDVKPGAPAKKP